MPQSAKAFGKKIQASGGPKVHQNQPAPSPGQLGQSQGLPSPASPPGAQGTWNPGEKNPTVEPFLTGDDIMAFAQAKQAYESQLADLDQAFAESVANTGYEKGEITKGAIQGKADTNWDAAGRGLFRSSIRDADLFDIDATAEMRKRFLDTQLDTLKLHTETQKHALDTMWNDPETGFLHGIELKKIANAQGVQGSMPVWKIEPHWEKPPDATKAKPQVAKAFSQKPDVVQNKPIGGKPATGGTEYKPGSSPPPKPKAKVGQASGASNPKKVMGKLNG